MPRQPTKKYLNGDMRHDNVDTHSNKWWRCADKTKYVRLYNQTPWGSYRMRCDEDAPEEICENRNKFVEKYNIKNSPSCDKTPKYVMKAVKQYYNQDKDYVDHGEYYKTHDNKWIGIISPNITKHNKKYQQAIDDGWIEIPKMYSPSCITFMKYLYSNSKKKEMKEDDKMKVICKTISKYVNKTYTKEKSEKIFKHLNESEVFNVLEFETLECENEVEVVEIVLSPK